VAEDMIAGRYRLLEPLGRGAMSSVWLAEDEELGRRVAVKMLAESADRARFDREARAAAALSHPHICQLYDYGEADGKPYMVLEYLSGGSLEERLRDGKPLPDEDAYRIASEVAAGLAHAHARGLVHRDMKPANILFDAEGRAKIADFGIARIGGAGTLTEAGTVLGTASYISPEQAAGQPATPASDVYSFGVILFRMITGRLPFESRNAMELVRMHRDSEPPPVSVFRPDAPARLESIASAALAKDPADRPPDGGAVLAELAASGDATTILTPGTAEATQILAARSVPRTTEGRRRPTLPVALGVLAALLIAGGAVALIATRSSDSSPPATTPGITLPNVPPGKRTTTSATTTQPSTTQATSTAPTTTEATTAPTTTRPLTTVAPPTTTAAPTTTAEPTTTDLPPTTTTAPTTTAPTTTDQTTTTLPPGQARKVTTTGP
jgi:serine/threonine-protein kinase